MAWGGLAENPDNPSPFYNEFEDCLDEAVENSDTESQEEIKWRILSNQKMNSRTHLIQVKTEMRTTVSNTFGI